MKYTIDTVREEVNTSGWKLISNEYKNLKTQMCFECPNGHENYYTMDYWRKHRDCPICKNNKYFVQNQNDKAPKKNGFRILAFDQATITSGWSVYDGDELIKYGSWTSEGLNSTEKINKTFHWFLNMVQIWKPDLIVLEDIQLQEKNNRTWEENVGTFKKLAHLQGVLNNYCYENNLSFKVVAPATWRAASKIKGKSRVEKKKSAQIIVKQLYNVSCTQDEADAILIGYWAIEDQKVYKIEMF